MNKPTYTSGVQAKTIEGDFRHIQVRLRASINRARRREPGAPQDLPKVAELRSLYEQTVQEHNAHLGGKLLEKPSPRKVWNTYKGKHPLQQMTDQSRFLMEFIAAGS
jgi:hypothetical protein